MPGKKPAPRFVVEKRLGSYAVRDTVEEEDVSIYSSEAAAIADAERWNRDGLHA